MGTSVMQLTHISLTLEERRVLDAEVLRTGKSLSSLIKDAVERVYGMSRSSDDDLDVMRQVVGTWNGHDEDGATMVERFRSGSRLPTHE